MAQSKRFYLFIQKQLTPQDAVPLRLLQECTPLQAHVGVIQVSSENVASIPQVVRQSGLPALLDSVTGSCSKDASAVLQAMIRRAGGGGQQRQPQPQQQQSAFPGRISVPVPQTHSAPPPPPQTPVSASSSAKGNTLARSTGGNLEMSEEWSKAESTSAASVFESRGSAVGGYGFAGGSFGSTSNASRLGSRVNEHDGWENASVGISADTAQRFLADSFGAIDGVPMPSSSTQAPRMFNDHTDETKKIDDSAMKSFIEMREQHDKLYKDRQNAAGIHQPTTGVAGGMSLSSKQERLAGAEGLQLLRPVVKPPASQVESFHKNVPF